MVTNDKVSKEDMEINAFESADIDRIIKMMEEMAKAPKEKMGERERGEIGSYERIRL